jgi:hypothetical protein
VSELPATPVAARIDAFDVSDGLGTLRLETGETVRFGRSACSFEPEVGLEVIVETVEVGRLGNVRATRVVLANAPPEPVYTERQIDLLLRPIASVTAWGLACMLSRPEQPHHLRARRAMRTELARRGKSDADIEEMIELARRANATINPPGSTIHQVIADAGDIRRALAGEADAIAAVIERHLD